MQKSVSLSDQIFEKLENDILSGAYQKGDILSEAKLYAELGVSRTPVREALKMLEQEHIIEDCGKGMRVLGITFQDAEHIYMIRERIEGLAAAECAKNITEEQLNELTELVDLQEFYTMKADSEKVKSIDTRFHEAIYKFSGIPVYYDTLVPLHKRIQKFRKTAVEQKTRASQSADEHRAVLDAIISRDPDKAEEAMKQHVMNAHARLREMFGVQS